MGYTAGTGTRGLDTYNSTPQTVADLQRLNDKIGERGHFRSGSTATRTALTGISVWEGLHFYDTSLDVLYKHDGSGWVAYDTTTTVSLTTFGTDWAATGGYSPFLVVTGKRREIFGAATRSVGGARIGFMTIPSGHRPAVNTFINPAITSNGEFAAVVVNTTGSVDLPTGYGAAPSAGVFPLGGVWYTA